MFLDGGLGGSTLSTNLSITGTAATATALTITPTGNQTGLEIANSGLSAEINLTGPSAIINAATQLNLTIAGTSRIQLDGVSPQVEFNGDISGMAMQRSTAVY